MNRETKIIVLLPASEIPTNATVSKRTGQAEYRLSRGINIYAQDPNQGTSKTVVNPAPGTVYLVGRTDITQYTEDTILAWHTTPEELWEQARASERG